MKKVFTTVLILLTATAPAAAQAAANNAQSVNEVRNLERSKFDALQREDKATLNALFDDALLLVDENGLLLTKAAFLSNKRHSDTQVLQIYPQTMSFREFGDVAIVVGIYVERGVRAGHPYLQRCRFIDTWMFKKGKWVCVAATALVAIS